MSNALRDVTLYSSSAVLQDLESQVYISIRLQSLQEASARCCLPTRPRWTAFPCSVGEVLVLRGLYHEALVEAEVGDLLKRTRHGGILDREVWHDTRSMRTVEDPELRKYPMITNKQSSSTIST